MYAMIKARWWVGYTKVTTFKLRVRMTGVRFLVASTTVISSGAVVHSITLNTKVAKPSINDEGILDNAGRGNIFMMLFFIRQLIESILNGLPPRSRVFFFGERSKIAVYK